MGRFIPQILGISERTFPNTGRFTEGDRRIR
jgi:hypothetical protein